jgi:hypothetical protein
MCLARLCRGGKSAQERGANRWRGYRAVRSVSARLNSSAAPRWEVATAAARREWRGRSFIGGGRGRDANGPVHGRHVAKCHNPVLKTFFDRLDRGQAGQGYAADSQAFRASLRRGRLAVGGQGKSKKKDPRAKAQLLRLREGAEMTYLGRRRALEVWGDQLAPQTWIKGAVGNGPYQHLTL